MEFNLNKYCRSTIEEIDHVIQEIDQFNGIDFTNYAVDLLKRSPLDFRTNQSVDMGIAYIVVLGSRSEEIINNFHELAELIRDDESLNIVESDHAKDYLNTIRKFSNLLKNLVEYEAINFSSLAFLYYGYEDPLSFEDSIECEREEFKGLIGKLEFVCSLIQFREPKGTPKIASKK